MAESITFQAVQPVRILGTSGPVPFCSIITEGKLIYSAGNNIVLQNIKTHEQKIVYTHKLQGETHLLTHHSTIYHEHVLAIAFKQTPNLLQAIVVIPLNTAIFSPEGQQDAIKVHYLKDIEEYETIENVKFLEESNIVGVISNYEKVTNFSMMRTSNGVIFYRQTFINTVVLMGSVNLNKLSCISLLLQDIKNGVRLCLMASDELGRKFYYSIKLQIGEHIIDYVFQPSPDQSVFLIALTSLGYIIFFKVNQFEAVVVSRVDVRLDARGEGMETALEEEGKLEVRGMQVAGNKIVISYQQSQILYLMQYSISNPGNYKSVILSDILDKNLNIKSTHSIRISKDGCSLAAMFLVDPQKQQSTITNSMPITTKVIPPQGINLSMTQSFINHQPSHQFIDSTPRDQFITLQIDLLSNLINHSDKKNSVIPTLTTCSCLAPVRKVQYCPHSNTMLVLLKNHTLKYYDLTPSVGPRQKIDYQMEKLMRWSVPLSSQPIGLASHPFNFSLLLLYSDILKFHNFNCKTILPAFLVAPVKHCRLASFSPLGDKVILATNNCFSVLDSYTLRTICQVSLPNMLIQPSLSSSQSNSPKSVTDLLYISHDELIVLSGNNTLTLVLNTNKPVHFGFFQSEQRVTTPIAYDRSNQLAVVALAEVVLVLSKATINSNNRCEVVSKLQVSATALLQVADLGVFFIGCKDGSLYTLKWPQYSQQDLYLEQQSYKTYLFDQPIISIHTTPSMAYLYAVSESGTIAICQLVVEDQEKLSNKIKARLLKCSDIPLRISEHWLMSRSDDEKKEREIIKLRGEEADQASNHTYLGKDGASSIEKKTFMKKDQLQRSYLTEIKEYETQLGLQKVLHEIQIAKDQLKRNRVDQKSEKEDLLKQMEQDLNNLFYQRKSLEAELTENEQNLAWKRKGIAQDLKIELDFLVEDFRVQNQMLQQSNIQNTLKKEQNQVVFFMQKDEMQQLDANSFKQLNQQFYLKRGKLFKIGQAILSKNRNSSIAYQCLQNKMGQLGIQKQKLEYDMGKVLRDQGDRMETQRELKAALEGNNQTYQKLIKCTRELQQQLVGERRNTSKLQHNMKKLTKDVQYLKQKQKQLQDSYQKTNSQFIYQKSQNQSCTSTLNQLHTTIQQLRNKKKYLHDQSCFSKTQFIHSVKTLQRQLEIEDKEVVIKIKADIKNRGSFGKQNQLGIQFQEQRQNFDNMVKTASKWKEFKDNYISGFRRNYKKLKGEHLKLTYQYNDLFKVSQDYRTQLSNLQEHIQQAKNQKHQRSCQTFHRRPQFKVDSSQNNKKGIRSSIIKKKGLCVSLHQEGKFITET